MVWQAEMRVWLGNHTLWKGWVRGFGEVGWRQCLRTGPREEGGRGKSCTKEPRLKMPGQGQKEGRVRRKETEVSPGKGGRWHFSGEEVGVCGWAEARLLPSSSRRSGGRWPPKLRRPQSGGAPHLYSPPSSGDRRCPLLFQTWEFITACRPGYSQASGQ